MKLSDRIIELDALRGIAAFIVLLCHYTTRYDDLYGHPEHFTFFFPYGHLGVQLFFIISGFVIFMTLEKTTKASDFLVSRFSRLFPTYWACLLITFVIVRIFTLPGRETTIAQAVLNLTMVHSVLKIPSVDGVYWTLFVELTFYAWMFTFYATRQMKHIYAYGTATLCLMLIRHVLMQYGYNIHPLISGVLLLRHGNLFISGILFYKLRREGISVKTVSLLIVCLAVHFIVNGMIAGAFITGCFLVFAFLSFYEIHPLRYKALSYVGGVSYALYLLHQNIGFVIIRTLNSQNFPQWAVVAIPMLASLGIASIVTFYIEKPAIRWIRSVYSNSRFASVKNP